MSGNDEAANAKSTNKQLPQGERVASRPKRLKTSSTARVKKAKISIKRNQPMTTATSVLTPLYQLNLKSARSWLGFIGMNTKEPLPPLETKTKRASV